MLPNNTSAYVAALPHTTHVEQPLLTLVFLILIASPFLHQTPKPRAIL